ncbi:molybdopterin molybdotransferase MoeA [Rhodanobacter sp. B2A1Ga4]|uniref:molybdopterin molybdotransferase MoeA n=1 Tax=Rhodanobacter sp. B2A1Ga4 TaxID=2778647 RepID=UPI001B35D692|nr:molybdopterin molybdotransferase MoeA [Rhodanobacter sp. B2A1Ga4]MBQ4855874.1 molybdopterin molybdotransferase MoeA [Rhodanobacter sp. B2A1Ga4]
MIDYVQALQRILAHAAPLPAQTCALAASPGRILASAIRSPIALPSFDNAAMDGYALRTREPLSAGSEHAVHGSQAAGDGARASAAGASEIGAWEIMTGAQLPAGLDAVVAVERTELLEVHVDGTPARIRLLDPLAAGDNVRTTGADVARDATVVVAGTRIESPHLMLLAALGMAQIEVVRCPRVAIICTGKELQNDATRPLESGRIHSSNGPYLVAALAAAGAQVLSCVTVDDTAITFADALQHAVDVGTDLIISTGAVSMGRYDFVPDTLRRCDAQLLFHHVAIRPGKPLLCATLANGPLILALPGTPMAVAVGVRFFVAPVLRAMAGQGSEPTLHAVLDMPWQPKPGLRHFLRASLHLDLDGYLHAAVPSQQQPFLIRPFAEADAWVVLPEDAGDCAAGTRVEIVSLEPGLPPRIRSPH